MKIEHVKKLSPLDRLLYFITERENVRLNKDTKEALALRACDGKPLTDDEILLQYRFCNVRRMDDRVSQWLLTHWYCEGRIDLVVAALARFFNWPPSLEAIGSYCKHEYNVSQIRKTLKKRRDAGLQIFNGAYLISPGQSEDKIDHVLDLCIAPLSGRTIELINPSSIEKSCHNLQECFGIGTFMAGQMVADLRHVLPGTWADKDTWAAIGPGSKRGMNRLHERDPDAGLTQAKFEVELRDLIKVCRKRLPTEIKNRLEAIDYQNCLCELDKYERTLWGQGRPKANYKPFEGY
jgi:hypothetical protein